MHRIFVVDDHAVMRRGYQFLIEAEPGLVFAGEAASAEDALVQIPELRPDLVVTDVALGGLNGIELVKRLRALDPALPVLVVSLHDEGSFAERALRAGARGYVKKGDDASAIVEAIRRLLAGGFYFSDAVQQHLFVQRHGRTPASRSALDTLTDRELELFEHIGQGRTTVQIAEAMHISPKTVETHRSRIKDKLGTPTVAELARRAVLWVSEQEATRAAGAPDAG